MYGVSEQELDTLGSNFSSASLAVFCAFLGITITVVAVYLTVPLDVRGHATAAAASLASAGITLLAGIQAWTGQRAAHGLVARIKSERRVP